MTQPDQFSEFSKPPQIPSGINRKNLQSANENQEGNDIHQIAPDSQ